MYLNTIRVAVAAIAVLFLTNTADARRYYHRAVHTYSSQHTEFCGDRYGACATSTPQARQRARHAYDANDNKARKRIRHRAARRMQVDKPQEYVKPSSPTEKLVTREVHELTQAGMVRVKTVQGFHITVNPMDSSKFLKLFALLKEAGHKVNPAIVGCYSPGGHKRGSNHHIGRACDIQTGWNRTQPFMYHARDLIKKAGLYDGCSFGDCGHIEAVRGLRNKRPNLYVALAKFQADQSTANFQP